MVWGIYALIKSATRKPDHTGRDGGALSILDQRLARGEIDSDEYRRLRDLITTGSPRTPAGSGTAA